GQGGGKGGDALVDGGQIALGMLGEGGALVGGHEQAGLARAADGNRADDGLEVVQGGLETIENRFREAGAGGLGRLGGFGRRGVGHGVTSLRWGREAPPPNPLSRKQERGRRLGCRTARGGSGQVTICAPSPPCAASSGDRAGMWRGRRAMFG